MTSSLRNCSPIFELIASSEMTDDIVTRIAAIAFVQAHLLAARIQDDVLPHLPPERRAVARTVANQLERREVLSTRFLDQLEAFRDTVQHRIDVGTRICWHGDVDHVRGGYEIVQFDLGARKLGPIIEELDMLADAILAVTSAAASLREVGSLLHQ